jgi:hypothetical protein
MFQRRIRETRCRVEELEGRVVPSIIVTKIAFNPKQPDFITVSGYTTKPAFTAAGGPNSNQKFKIIATQTFLVTNSYNHSALLTVGGADLDVPTKSPGLFAPSGATATFKAKLEARPHPGLGVGNFNGWNPGKPVEFYLVVTNRTTAHSVDVTRPPPLIISTI